MKVKVVYTAEHEEPDCGVCDHQCDNCYTDRYGDIHDKCVEQCGAEHGWHDYQRTEYEEMEYR